MEEFENLKMGNLKMGRMEEFENLRMGRI